jgi:hypothetical protein
VTCNGPVVVLEGNIEVDEDLVEEVCIGLAVEVGLGVGVDGVAGGADVEVGLGVDVAGAGMLLAGVC